MTSLRFHRALYPASAVSEAVAVFADHGQLRVDDSGADHVVVHLDATDVTQQEALAGAFANYALGASVHAQQRHAGSPEHS